MCRASVGRRFRSKMRIVPYYAMFNRPVRESRLAWALGLITIFCAYIMTNACKCESVDGTMVAPVTVVLLVSLTLLQRWEVERIPQT